jgi:ABC-type cobalamin/Fe3+-siderophores transport system ATPase subunit
MDKELKRKILIVLTANDDYLGKYFPYDGLMAFLSRVWPLRNMPSKSDDRYSTQYDSIFQHRINNNDWDNEQLYEDELNIVNGEERFFISFLETVVSPETRNSRDEITFYVELINKNLSGIDQQLIITDYFEGLPVYRLRDKTKYKDLPRDIVSNRIPFFKSQAKISEYPCFALSYDKWNDYNYITKMNLTYFPSKGQQYLNFGNVKIFKRGERETWVHLLDKFTELSQDFCSMGQSSEYYQLLKQQFPDTYQSILLALRDAGIFPKIMQDFENEQAFKKSLIRGNDIEQLSRSIRFTLSDSTSSPFGFSYNYKPPYAEEMSVINFAFSHQGKLPNRVYALIGKNGAGKTSILSGLANELSLQNPQFLSPRKPLNSKYFTVSYSVFDRFKIPEENASFSYVYCGLKKTDGTIIPDDEQKDNFLKSARMIGERNLLIDWYAILVNFFTEDILENLFTWDSSFSPPKILAFNESEYLKRRYEFSSGETLLLYILSRIISEIRFDSLILYDEPETHLHPNAISRLMNTLFELLDRFKSFCILATHSPLVIQEIHARNIIILDREENELSIRKMSKDSFGENLTVITDEIFNNRDINKYHLGLMKDLVNEGISFEEIISIFKFDDLPVNVNTRLYLKSLIAAKE